MRSISRIWLCGSLALCLIVWSSTVFAKDKGAVSQGIGNIVSGLAKSGIHGKELATQVHELIAARKSARDQAKGKGKGKPDHAGKGKGKDKDKGKPDFAGKGGKGKGGKPNFAGKGGKGKKGR